MSWSPAEYNRANYSAIMPRKPTSGVVVPANVKRADTLASAPCVNCGSRIPCRHRPWL